MNRIEYLLSKLGEEAGEVAQMAAKVSQFGFTECYLGGPSNADRLKAELTNLLTVVDMLTDDALFDYYIDPSQRSAAKVDKVNYYWDQIRRPRNTEATISQRINTARKAKGFTISQMASVTGTAYTSAKQWCDNGASIPRARDIVKLCHGLGVDPNYIMGHVDETLRAVEDVEPAKITFNGSAPGAGQLSTSAKF
ncbi:MAG: helix-turn-helix transcriptional regulator [Planctomycetes bacterium]|nr:helix-turn-helix transcriptional regulator [Planctomycetota bacterium]